MPRILTKDVLVEIRHSKGRFLSILLIVALGTAFFAGIKASAPDMKTSADQHFDNANVQDIQVYSTLGIQPEDLAAIARVQGVSDVQGLKTMDALTKVGSREQVVRVFSWNKDQTINVPRLVEGRMPEKADECVLEAATATNEMFGTMNIGDTFSLYSGTDTPLQDDLSESTFTIVGKAYNPNYLSYEKGTSSIGAGGVETFMYIEEGVFKTDYYSEADVTVEDAREADTYSDDYFALTDPVVEAIENIADKQIDDRIAALQKELDEQKSDATSQLSDAKTELEEAKTKLDDGKSQLDAGRQELDASQAQIQQGQSELANGKAQLADAQQEIASGQSQIADSEAQLADAKAQLDAGWAEYNSGKQALEEGKAQIETALAQIEAAQAQLPQLQAQKAQLEQAVASMQSLQSAISGLESLSAQQVDVQGQIAYLQATDPDNPQIAALQAGLAQIEGQIAQIAGQLSGGAASDAASGIAAGQAAIAQITATVPDPAGALAQVEAGIAEIQNGASQKDALLASQQELAGKQQELDAALATLQNSQAQYDSGLAQLQDARNQLASAQSQYQQGLSEIQSSEAQLADGQAKWQSGQQEYETSKADYEKGLRDYEEGLQEYNDKKKEADDKIADGQKEIDDLEGEWIVLDRNSHYSYRDYESCADRMDGIASVFPVFFFLVAALVCMTTMTRMVQEERTDIGTLKALGYSKGQIAFKYLFYAGLASVLGCVVGCSLGMVIFPAIIFYAWNTMYNLEAIVFTFPWQLIALSSLSVTGIVLAATFYSIYRELMEVPSQLMRPKAAKAGKKILLERLPWIWNKVSFMHKVTLRNLFRDKKRFFMTIVGIAGCSALLVAGFGLNDSISDIVPRQFDEIYHYNATVTADKDQENVEEELAKIDGISEIHLQQILPITVRFDDKDIGGFLNILDDPNTFKDFMTFIPMEGSAPDMKLDDEGVFISIKTAQKMNLGIGDTIEFTTTDDEKVSAKVTGIFDQYIDHQIFCTQKLFESWHLQETPDASFLLINESDDDAFESDLGTDIMNVEGIKSVTFYSSAKKNFMDMIASIKSVVVVLVLSAAMLAFVVLYNLSNVNISERMREIATIKVLGFTEKETNQYINRETLILSAIGAAIGLLIGIYLHGMIMNLAELDSIRFGRTINPMSFVYSFLLTMVFTWMINWMMKFRLRKIEMVESLKAVE